MPGCMGAYPCCIPGGGIMCGEIAPGCKEVHVYTTYECLCKRFSVCSCVCVACTCVSVGVCCMHVCKCT